MVIVDRVLAASVCLKGWLVDEEAIVRTVKGILETLPAEVTLVAAAKSRSVEEVRAALRAGVTCVGHNYVQEAQRMVPLIQLPARWHMIVGHNYVQEAQRMVPLIQLPARWHMIGHLQRNKAKTAVALFDMIETLDSWPLAREIEKRCAAIDKVMLVLVEVNSGREASKTGVLPEEVDEMVRRVTELPHVRIQGLMTMGPRFGDPEDARPYFRATREAFLRLAAAEIPNVEMRYLSMGMSNSYRVAIEEGANMVRIGTLLFGERSA
jgi:pyridoxal phosphate enzyme (YggS family)